MANILINLIKPNFLGLNQPLGNFSGHIEISSELLDKIAEAMDKESQRTDVVSPELLKIVRNQILGAAFVLAEYEKRNRS